MAEIFMTAEEARAELEKHTQFTEDIVESCVLAWKAAMRQAVQQGKSQVSEGEVNLPRSAKFVDLAEAIRRLTGEPNNYFVLPSRRGTTILSVYPPDKLIPPQGGSGTAPPKEKGPVSL